MLIIPQYQTFILNHPKCKRATLSKVPEKRESIVSVTSSSLSELLDMLRNCDKSRRLLTKQSFVVEVMGSRQFFIYYYYNLFDKGL